MELDRLLDKLDPLLPDQVKQWRRSLPVVDESVRKLLERQIQVVAARELGEVRRQFLLPPPPKNRARGELKLGMIQYGRLQWPAGLSRAELLQNLAVYGRSGAGKTNVVFHLLLQLVEQQIPFLFLDWKRTGRHLLPLFKKQVHVYTPGRSLLPFPFNPFLVPPGMERQTWSLFPPV